MRREKALGGCLTLGVMIFAASFIFYGWSTPMRSLDSFGSSAGLPDASPAESEIISQTLDAYGVDLSARSPWKETICSAPATTRHYSWMEFQQGIIYSYNNQHRRYGREPPEGFEELELRDSRIEYTQLGLRAFGASVDPDGDRFLVPYPWQTARCDGWLSVTGPVIDGDRAFIEISRKQGAPVTGKCRWIRALFLKDKVIRGAFREGWTKVWSHREFCYPVY